MRDNQGIFSSLANGVGQVRRRIVGVGEEIVAAQMEIVLVEDAIIELEREKLTQGPPALVFHPLIESGDGEGRKPFAPHAARLRRVGMRQFVLPFANLHMVLVTEQHGRREALAGR